MEPRLENLRRAGYASTLESFFRGDSDRIIGKLTAQAGDVLQTQVLAWQREIEILRDALPKKQGYIFFEFEVPRLGSRVDVIVVFDQHVIPIEFKVEQTTYTRSDIDQAWDYGLDLKNFHRASHSADVWPILVATDAATSDDGWQPAAHDSVRPPRCVNANGLAQALDDIARSNPSVPIDGIDWASAPYHPTPTIIQAAQALYASHSVDAIARNDAGALNLAVTSGQVEEVIRLSEERREKAIVFVTGVPGAGKTLVGLDIATAKRQDHLTSHAVFLSGNGPLVAVLTESLARDEVRRRRLAGDKVRKGDAKQPIKKFIQNVHHFRDEGLRDKGAPHDRVVIFDEAQRAWNLSKTSDFMKRKKKQPGFSQSEPEFLIGYMDRHPDWAVIVCLVGGGQEINTGEAGIGAWLDAISSSYPNWKVYVSPHLGDSEYRATEKLEAARRFASVQYESNLHLS
ncbi:MAG: DNA/RNA helicase domain-containing protein, partial [Gemmatimonadaceae bacterium]